MRHSTFWGTFPSVLFFGFIATATALALKDHHFNTPEDPAQFVPRDAAFDFDNSFENKCNSWSVDNNTCIATASCLPKGEKSDRKKASLDLNQCFLYHEHKDVTFKWEWQVDWNKNDEDRKG